MRRGVIVEANLTVVRGTLGMMAATSPSGLFKCSRFSWSLKILIFRLWTLQNPAQQRTAPIFYHSDQDAGPGEESQIADGKYLNLPSLSGSFLPSSPFVPTTIRTAIIQ